MIERSIRGIPPSSSNRRPREVVELGVRRQPERIPAIGRQRRKKDLGEAPQTMLKGGCGAPRRRALAPGRGVHVKPNRSGKRADLRGALRIRSTRSLPRQATNTTRSRASRKYSTKTSSWGSRFRSSFDTECPMPSGRRPGARRARAASVSRSSPSRPLSSRWMWTPNLPNPRFIGDLPFVSNNEARRALSSCHRRISGSSPRSARRSISSRNQLERNRDRMSRARRRSREVFRSSRVARRSR